jgi:hypothetical protein
VLTGHEPVTGHVLSLAPANFSIPVVKARRGGRWESAVGAGLAGQLVETMRVRRLVWGDAKIEAL